jgi:hypothetical protein
MNHPALSIAWKIRKYKFPLLYVTGIMVLVTCFGYFSVQGSKLGIDITAALILSTTNAFIGYLTFDRSYRYEGQISIMIALVGMFIRFVLMAIVVTVLIAIEGVQAGPFIACFMSTYVIFQIFEIVQIHRGAFERYPATRIGTARTT